VGWTVSGQIRLAGARHDSALAPVDALNAGRTLWSHLGRVTPARHSADPSFFTNHHQDHAAIGGAPISDFDSLDVTA
jgi:hypothetical protein